MSNCAVENDLESPMAFQSDRAALRTFDTERGWELFLERSSMGAFNHFRLEHTSGYKLRFAATSLPGKSLGRDANGKPRSLIRYEVYGIRSSNDETFSLIPSAQRALIQEALENYGGGFTGPMGPVEITFS